MSSDKDLFGRMWGGHSEAKEPERRQNWPAATPATPSTEDGFAIPAVHPDRHYVAFKIGKRPERIHIDRAIKPSRFLAYHYLVDMNFDPALESIFTLFYTSATVEVTGDRLWPIVYAIWHGRCESIHAYHPELYEPPPSGLPMIDAITISTPSLPRE
jgi:hypothetical protein